ncbi:MAG: M28 family peptidase, partial [Thermoplasmata archaeon]
MKKRKLCNLAIFLMLVSLTAPLAFHYPYQDFTQKVSLDLKPNSNIGFRSAFLGANANASVIEQCNMGYRIPNSSASLECAWYIHDKLETYGLEAEFQDFVGESGEGAGVKFRNVIGTLRTDKETNRTLLLGAHYDTRPFSNTNVSIPVMGANDGASGVAILLELARIFGENATKFNFTIKMLFFDGEDFGNGTNSMFYGSRYYASNMSAEEISNTVGMILLDMVGDADLQIYREGFSDSNLTDMLMNAASKLGYLSDGSPGFQGFYNYVNHYVIDDHIQFKDKGIPSIDIIDFDYPYWHTDEDTPDKVSAQSLEIVGRTVEQLVYMINEKESAKSKPVGIIDRISPSPAILGEKVFFNSSGIDEDGNVVAYKWISDIDGIISTERNFSISNLSAGTHMITLIVTDNDGLESIPVTQILIVNEIRVELGDEYIVPAGITTEFKLNELNLSENGKIRIFGKLTLTKTYIKLGNNGSIIVESVGSLEAKDTVFDSKGGYELVSYGKVLIENCTLKNISYAKPERELDEIYAPKESGLRIYSSESRIANSSISGCKGLGIMCINSSPEIIGNKIWNNQEGAILLYN